MSRDLIRRLNRIESQTRVKPIGPVIQMIDPEWYRRQPPSIEDMKAVMRASQMTVAEWEAQCCTDQSDEVKSRASRLWYADRIPDVVSPPPDAVQ